MSLQVERLREQCAQLSTERGVFEAQATERASQLQRSQAQAAALQGERKELLERNGVLEQTNFELQQSLNGAKIQNAALQQQVRAGAGARAGVRVWARGQACVCLRVRCCVLCAGA